MPARVLIAAALVSGSLVKPDMPEAERLKIMRPYFYPPPGEEVEINPEDLVNKKYKKNILLYKGHVLVRPPKGHCFTITRNPEIPDDVICEEKRLTFTLGHLDHRGRFSWKIKTSKDDYGHTYTWHTPHRFSQAIPMGEKETKKIPVNRCIAYKGTDTRRIVLQMMNNEQWTITFPEVDKLLAPSKPFPNLYMPKRRVSGGIDSSSGVGKDSSGDPYLDHKIPEHSDPVTAHWSMPIDGSYSMNAANFKTMDSAPGMKGTCRYQYDSAPKDPESGWIECHDADQYDVIFIPLSCAARLKPPEG